MADDSSDSHPGTPIGQIPIRRVSRADLKAGKKGGDVTQTNPMNRLVPYLDLFARLTDAELSRLADVPEATSQQLRKQVDAVGQALARYRDLLPRLHDAELMRLTGASAKTVRFWRLCQPKDAQGDAESPASAEPEPEKREARGTGEYAATPTADRHARPATRARPGQRGAPTGPHPPVPAASSREGGSESSGVRVVAARAAPATPKPPAPQPAAAQSQLGLSGAPFPGYDYDPGEAAALDDDADGIFLGLELPEPGAPD